MNVTDILFKLSRQGMSEFSDAIEYCAVYKSALTNIKGSISHSTTNSSKTILPFFHTFPPLYSFHFLYSHPFPPSWLGPEVAFKSVRICIEGFYKILAANPRRGSSFSTSKTTNWDLRNTSPKMNAESDAPPID